MEIYFAGSIRGGRDDAQLYGQIIRHLQRHGDVLTEHVGDTTVPLRGEVSAKDVFIHDRDMDWVLESNVLVAEVTSPSLGVGYEIGRALESNKPILCLYRPQEGKRLSAMIGGSGKLRNVEYRNLEDACSHIDTFFSELRRDAVHVVVGSKNPVKINATQQAFSRHFPYVEVTGVSVPSGVREQPIGEETYVGARNRAQRLVEQATDHPQASYFVGIEGGFEETHGEWFSFGCMSVLDKEGREGLGKTSHFILPPSLMKRIHEGEELGPVMDDVTGKANVKQGAGAIGILTHGMMDRTDLYVQGIITALIPHLNKELYT